MVKVGKKQTKNKRRLLFLLASLFFLLTAAGVTLYRLPLSLQDIGSVIQLAVGKIENQSADKKSAEPVLRGTIYDRNYKELGVSYLLYDIIARPNEIEDKTKTISRLEEITGKTKENIEDSFNKTHKNIKIAGYLSQDQASEVKQLDLAGIYIKPNETRFYPEHTMAAHLLGFSDNNIGLKGAEGLYDTILQPGEFIQSDAPEVDFAGEKILGRSRTDIVLTLDTQLQKKTDELLKKYMKDQQMDQAMAIVLDIRTGGVLSFNSLPTFDPNYYWKADESNQKSLHDSIQFDLGMIHPLLARTARSISSNGMGTDLPPVFVASQNLGLTSEQIVASNQKLGLYTEIDCYLPLCQKDNTDHLKPAETHSPQQASCLKITNTFASLLNGGYKLKPFFLESIFDHNLGKSFGRNNLIGTATTGIFEPAQGVKVRRELSRLKKNNKQDYVFIHGSTVKTIATGNFSKYVNQEILIGWVPKKIPDILLVVAAQRSHLAPLKKQVKKKKITLPGLGTKLLPFLHSNNVRTTGDEIVLKPTNENLERFLISRQIDHPQTKLETPVSLKKMPNVLGLSLRKGLQELNHLKLNIRAQGTGRIVSQDPKAGTSLENIEEVFLLLEPELP